MHLTEKSTDYRIYNFFHKDKFKQIAISSGNFRTFGTYSTLLDTHARVLDDNRKSSKFKKIARKESKSQEQKSAL